MYKKFGDVCSTLTGHMGLRVEGSLIVRMCGWDKEMLGWDTEILSCYKGTIQSLFPVDQTSTKFLHLLWVTPISFLEDFVGN